MPNSLHRSPHYGIFFGLVLLATTPLVLIAFAPWRWELPAISILAGFVALPLLFALAIHAVLLFLYSALWKREFGHKDLLALGIVFVYATAGAAAITFVDALAASRTRAVLILTASAIVLFKFLRPKSDASASRIAHPLR
jgi:hypothetical protein